MFEINADELSRCQIGTLYQKISLFVSQRLFKLLECIGEDNAIA